jgi:hypothetical protein
VDDSGKYGECAMTREELHRFLADTDVVMLASLRKDGAPFVVPVGFDFDGESFFVTVALDHGARYRLRRDPRVSLAAGSHPAFPTKFVVVEGVAEEQPDPDHAMSRRILFRKSEEMFARLAVDRERFFAQWISVGRASCSASASRSSRPSTARSSRRAGSTRRAPGCPPTRRGAQAASRPRTSRVTRAA